LPKEILQLEIDDIQSLGVEIKTNTEVGKDIMFEELCNEYDAVFIGAGARLTSKLNIPNEDVQGVIPALNFLRKVNLDEPVDVKGKRIIVIGGGNVAIDAARTSLRLGAKEVAIIYRRTKDEMPASIEEIEDAEYEGVKIRLLVTPVRIIAQNGKVVGIECIKMQLSEFFDASGRRRPVEIPGSEFVIDTDIVIPAIGQQVDTGFVGDNLKTTKWGTIIVDPETQATSMKGVFAGGDVVTGAATVIDAISAGNRAAIAIDKYLNNGKESEEVISGGRRPSLVEDKEPSKISRHRMPTLDKERRVAGFEEVELGFTREMAVREAQRCLRCHEKE
jgi:NADPH-dependent glutamate synthase beta subunit-like oxidoreductase